MKRVKTITKEQREYRDAINMLLPELTTRKTYMKNCMYWIHKTGVEKERVLKAAFYLKKYCEEIIRELNS